tara:strand:+ start:12440 stop:14443 length:2004 start_codon:yes stop_codon:yes gene_type:complete
MDRDQVAMKHIFDTDKLYTVANGKILPNSNIKNENINSKKIINQADITLVMAPAWGILFPPYNIAKLTGHLRKNNISVLVKDTNIDSYHILKDTQYSDVFDGDKYWMWIDEVAYNDNLLPMLEDLFEETAELIASIDTDIIGFSMYNTNKLSVKWFLDYFEFHYPEKVIVIGGPEIYYNIPTWSHVDYFFRGEAENSLLQLIKNNPKKQEKFKIIGSWYEATETTELNNISWPDYSDYDFSLYTHSNGISSEVSRGCVAKCSFCTETHFWKYRYRNQIDVVDEIKEQKKLVNLQRVWFVDSLVNGNIKQLEAIADKLVKDKVDISWNGYARCHPKMDERYFQKLVNSGCTGLSFGVESGSNKILKSMNKKIKVETVYQNLKDASSVRSNFDVNRRIHSHINWIVGYPDETKTDLAQSLSLLYNIRKYADGISPGATLGIVKGTYLGDDYEKYNISTDIRIYKDWTDNTFTCAKPHRSLRLLFTVLLLDIMNMYLEGTTLDNNQHRQELDDKWSLVFDSCTGVDLISINDDDNFEYIKQLGQPVVINVPVTEFNEKFWSASISNEWFTFSYILNKIFNNFEFTLQLKNNDFLDIFGTYIGIPYEVSIKIKSNNDNVKIYLNHAMHSHPRIPETLFINVLPDATLFKHMNKSIWQKEYTVFSDEIDYEM